MSVSPNLFNNASWGGISAAIRLIFGMANLFLAIRLVGATDYGYIALMMSVSLIYLTFINSIHTIVVTHAADIKKAKDTRQRLECLFSTVWFFTLVACGVITLVTVIFGRVFVDSFVYWGNDELVILELHRALICVLLMLVFQLITAANVAVIESLGRFDLAAKAQIIGPILSFIFFAVMFFIGDEYSISNITLVMAFSVIFDCLITSIVRIRMGFLSSYYPQKGILKILPTLLKHGAALQSSRLIIVFVDPFNKYLLNLLVGSASVAIYDVAMKTISGIQGLFGGAFRTFLQLTSRMRDNAGRDYVQLLKYGLVPALILHALVGMFVIIASNYWFASDSEGLSLLFYLMIPASLLIIFTAPLYYALIGVRDLRFIFKMNLNVAIFNVIGSIIFIKTLGVLGSVVGFTIVYAYNAIMEYRRYILKLGSIHGIKEALKEQFSISLFVSFVGVIPILTYYLINDEIWFITINIICASFLMCILINHPMTKKLIKRYRSF